MPLTLTLIANAVLDLSALAALAFVCRIPWRLRTGETSIPAHPNAVPSAARREAVVGVARLSPIADRP